MNTKSQNSMETIRVLAPVSDSGKAVGMSKVFVKRFDGVSMARWQEMADWCYNNLYHGGYYEPRWHHQYPSFYFKDEKEYMLFLLRWS